MLAERRGRRGSQAPWSPPPPLPTAVPVGYRPCAESPASDLLWRLAAGDCLMGGSTRSSDTLIPHNSTFSGTADRHPCLASNRGGCCTGWFLHPLIRISDRAGEGCATPLL